MGDVVDELDALPHGTVLEDEDGVVQLRQDVDLLVAQRHAAVDDLREVQKVLDDAGQAGRFIDDDLHAALHERRVGIADGLQGLRPAFDGGQRCLHLVGDRGDEVVLHLVGRAQFIGHEIDVLRQFGDLVVVLLRLHPGGHVSPGDTLRDLIDLPDRLDDGVDERDTGDDHDEPDGEEHDEQREQDADDLQIRLVHRHDIADRAERLIALHEAMCAGVDRFSVDVPAAENSTAGAVFHRFIEIGHRLVFDRETGARDDDMAGGVDDPDIHDVLVLKALDIEPGRVFEGRVVGLRDEKLPDGIRVHILDCVVCRGAVIVPADDEDRDKYQKEDRHDEHRAGGEPAAVDAGQMEPFSGLLFVHAFSSVQLTHL